MSRDSAWWKRVGPWLLAAMNLVWGASYLVADIGLRHMEPGALAAWRFLIASALLFPWLALSHASLRLRRRDVLRVAAIGCIAVAGTYLLTYQGIRLASSTDRAMISPLEPVALALLGAVVLGERLKARQWGGIALACLGAYLLIARRVDHAGGLAPQTLGQILMLLSFFTEGAYSILGKPLLGRYRPLTLTTWAMAFAALVLFAVFAARGQVPPPPPTPSAWGAVLFLAIPCTVVGYTLWYMALEHLPAGVLGVFIFLQPVVGVALGVRFRQETLSVLLLAGALCIIAGVWLTGSTEAAQPVPDPEPSA